LGALAVIFADFFLAAALEDVFAAAFLLFFFAGFAISNLSPYARFVTRAVLSYIPIWFSTTILLVQCKTVTIVAIFLLTACSNLTNLTPELLNQAQAKWNSSKPRFYKAVIEMKGDRVEKAVFEVTVTAGKVAELRRNGLHIQLKDGEDYSVDGLFRIMHQEQALAEKPALLGAPAGYSAYLMAQFDDQTGRPIAYRRTVGGTTNTIDIRVLEFSLQDSSADPR